MKLHLVKTQSKQANKDENVTIFFKNLQNIALASVSHCIVLIDLVTST